MSPIKLQAEIVKNITIGIPSSRAAVLVNGMKPSEIMQVTGGMFEVALLSFERSAILGFLGYYRFPPFAPLDTRTNVMPATLVAGPFLIPHYFLLSGFLLQKPLADFLFWGVLKSCPLIFLLSRLLDPTFLDSTFGCLSLSHFSQVS
ncbi:hypothetical protein SO802_034062 [Lithocarpus litseifolius]|uniref:Uncharacterized protein n=1 Tax=Lithocarpus litseifolius TaxID=425828 RepID=A0AAW2BFK1_9ROSI